MLFLEIDFEPPPVEDTTVLVEPLRQVACGDGYLRIVRPSVEFWLFVVSEVGSLSA